MRFVKSSFYILRNRNFPMIYRLGQVIGWRDEEGEFGFHKVGKVWHATDIFSGCLICVCPTRKECVEWIEENYDLIRRKKRTEDYQKKVHEKWEAEQVMRGGAHV